MATREDLIVLAEEAIDKIEEDGNISGALKVIYDIRAKLVNEQEIG